MPANQETTDKSNKETQSPIIKVFQQIMRIENKRSFMTERELAKAERKGEKERAKLRRKYGIEYPGDLPLPPRKDRRPYQVQRAHTSSSEDDGKFKRGRFREGDDGNIRNADIKVECHCGDPGHDSEQDKDDSSGSDHDKDKSKSVSFQVPRCEQAMSIVAETAPQLWRQPLDSLQGIANQRAIIGLLIMVIFVCITGATYSATHYSECKSPPEPDDVTERRKFTDDGHEEANEVKVPFKEGDYDTLGDDARSEWDKVFLEGDLSGKNDAEKITEWTYPNGQKMVQDIIPRPVLAPNLLENASDRLKSFYKRFMEVDEKIRQMQTTNVDSDEMGRVKRSPDSTAILKANITAVDNANSTIDKRDTIEVKQLERKTKCSHVKTESKSHEQNLKHPYYKHSERLDELLDKIDDNRIEEANREHFRPSFKEKARKCSHSALKTDDGKKSNHLTNSKQYYRYNVDDSNLLATGFETTTPAAKKSTIQSFLNRLNFDIVVAESSGMPTTTEFRREANDSGTDFDSPSDFDVLDIEDKKPSNVATFVQNANELYMDTDYNRAPKMYTYVPTKTSQSDRPEDRDNSVSLPVYPDENILSKVADGAVKESHNDPSDVETISNRVRMDAYADGRDLAVAQAYSDYGVLEDKKGKSYDKDFGYVNKLLNSNRVKFATNLNPLEDFKSDEEENWNSNDPTSTTVHKKIQNKQKGPPKAASQKPKIRPTAHHTHTYRTKEQHSNYFKKRSLLSIENNKNEFSDDDINKIIETFDLNIKTNATDNVKDPNDKIGKRSVLDNIYDEDYGVDYEPETGDSEARKAPAKVRPYYSMFKKLMAFASHANKKDKKKKKEVSNKPETPVTATQSTDAHSVDTVENMWKTEVKTMTPVLIKRNAFEASKLRDSRNVKYFTNTGLNNNLHSKILKNRDLHISNILISSNGYNFKDHINKRSVEPNCSNVNVTVSTECVTTNNDNVTKGHMNSAEKEKEIVSASTFKVNHTRLHGNFTHEANRTLAKRSVEITPKYWNDLFKDHDDDESDLVEDVKSINGTKREEDDTLKSKRDRFTRTAGVKQARSINEFGNNAYNNTVDFSAMMENMKEVFKEAAAEVEATRSLRRDEAKGGHDEVMLNLAALMSELLDLRVEQNNCRKLPADLKEFLQWLTDTGDQTSTPQPEDLSQFEVKDEEEVPKRETLSPAEKSKKLYAFHSIKDLLGQYNVLDSADRVKMAGVYDYLRKQLRLLESQLENANSMEDMYRNKRQMLRHVFSGNKMAPSFQPKSAGHLRKEDLDRSHEVKRNLQDVYYRALEESRKMSSTPKTSIYTVIG